MAAARAPVVASPWRPRPCKLCRSKRANRRTCNARPFEDWERAVLEVEPALDEDGLRSLRDDLEAWLTAIIRRHGVESALILYPEEPRAKELYAELELCRSTSSRHAPGE